MTRLEVGGVAVDHLPVNTKVEGGASRTVIIIITDPLLVDLNPQSQGVAFRMVFPLD